MTKQIFVYAGPHRSGSNFLNNKVLPFIPGVFTAFTRDPELNYILLNAMEGHPLFTDYDAIRAEINERLEKIEEDIVLIGDEEFFGDYGKRNSGGMFRSTPFHDHVWKMDLLKRVLDDPKIVLTIRRQDKWVESSYMHYIHNYFTLSFDEFIDPERSVRGAYYERPYEHRSEKISTNYKMLDWTVYLQHLFDNFGKDNVLVIPNEMMARDLPRALTRLYDFMGIKNGYFPTDAKPSNRSYSKLGLKIALVLNRFVFTEINCFGFIPETPFQTWVLRARRRKDNKFLWFCNGIIRRIRLYWFLNEVVGRFNYQRPDPLSPEKRREILEYFRDSNKRYAEMIGVDLSEYDYY